MSRETLADSMVWFYYKPRKKIISSLSYLSKGAVGLVKIRAQAIKETCTTKGLGCVQNKISSDHQGSAFTSAKIFRSMNHNLEKAFKIELIFPGLGVNIERGKSCWKHLQTNEMTSKNASFSVLYNSMTVYYHFATLRH